MPYDTGALLDVRGQRWLLTRAAPYGHCTILTLEGRGAANANERLQVIDPFDRPRPIAATKIVRRPRRAVLRAALGAIVDARPAHGLWMAAAASIDLLPYQLEPALAAVSGTTRLLLADAVGLGKTIQAGLLLAELSERGWVERALIICPAGLCDTWARELALRFNIRAGIVDQRAIADRIASLPAGVNPWADHAVAIASIDFIKRAEVMAAIASAPIDLLIADEAHHLAPGTDRGEAAGRLAARAPWCVLVSATPHSGDEAAFTYLKNIGSHREPIAIFRRSRGDVGLAGARRSHLLAVGPTGEESALFTALDRYTRAIWHERGRHDRAVRLIAITLARRAASSAAAITRTLLRRHELLASALPLPAQPLLPWDDGDDSDRIETDAILAIPGLDSTGDELAAIARLIELSRRCAISSKMRHLVRLLDRVGEPAIVFTEYRDTLDALVAILQPHRRIAALHGGVPAAMRRLAVDALNEGRVDVLVATDAAGEGLNLHHRCRLVIDVELPWNPLRLEQRIGRVDRIGQSRIVHAIRMFHRGTIEQRVLAHLRLRDRRAAAALDRQTLTETAIASAVFEDGQAAEATPVSIASDRVADVAAEARRLEGQRRARAHCARSPTGIVWAAPKNRRDARFVLIHRRSRANSSGTLIASDSHAHNVRIAAGDRRELRTAIERISAATRQSIAAASTDATATNAAVRGSMARRIGAIRIALKKLRVEEQASLFDRRSESAAMAREQTVATLEQALARVEAAIAPPSSARTRVELVAAWPGAPATEDEL